MARRPDYRPEEVLSKEDLPQLSHNLAHLSESGVRDLYLKPWEECRLTARDFPCPRAVQQLVTAWKVLRRWRRR